MGSNKQYIVCIGCIHTWALHFWAFFGHFVKCFYVCFCAVLYSVFKEVWALQFFLLANGEKYQLFHHLLLCFPAFLSASWVKSLLFPGVCCVVWFLVLCKHDWWWNGVFWSSSHWYIIFPLWKKRGRVGHSFKPILGQVQRPTCSWRKKMCVHQDVHKKISLTANIFLLFFFVLLLSLLFSYHVHYPPSFFCTVLMTCWIYSVVFLEWVDTYFRNCLPPVEWLIFTLK